MFKSLSVFTVLIVIPIGTPASIWRYTWSHPAGGPYKPRTSSIRIRRRIVPIAKIIAEPILRFAYWRHQCGRLRRREVSTRPYGEGFCRPHKQRILASRKTSGCVRQMQPAGYGKKWTALRFCGSPVFGRPDRAPVARCARVANAAISCRIGCRVRNPTAHRTTIEVAGINNAHSMTSRATHGC